MKKFQVLSIACICLVFAGCTNQQANQTIAALRSQLSEAQGQNSKLKARVDELSRKVKALANTPSARLEAIRQLVAKRDLNGASAVSSELKSKYPNAQQTQAAEQLVRDLSARLQAEQEKQARLQKLKFRALDVTPTFTSSGITFRTLKMSTTSRWISDSYQYEYHYSDADRGTKYVVLRVNISSTNDKDPKLFPVAVYRVVGNKLDQVADFSYAFRRWHDYGSYLGNYGDSGNSFAKSKTVEFTLAAQVSDTYLKEPLLIVASDEQCVERINRDLAPAVAYIELSCTSLKQELPLSEMAGKKYHVIKRLNF
jgi:hypothetical protein